MSATLLANRQGQKRPTDGLVDARVTVSQSVCSRLRLLRNRPPRPHTLYFYLSLSLSLDLDLDLSLPARSLFFGFSSSFLVPLSVSLCVFPVCLFSVLCLEFHYRCFLSVFPDFSIFSFLSAGRLYHYPGCTTSLAWL